MPEQSRLRVLMVLESRFPSPYGGGAESQVRTLGRALRAQGHGVTVITPRFVDGDTRGVARHAGLAVCRLAYPSWRGIGAFVLYLRLALLLWSRRARYDVIHVHIAHKMGAIASWLGRALGLRVVVKFSGWWEVEHGVLRAGGGPVARAARAMLRRASAYQAISTRLARALVERGFVPSRIHCVPNAVDIARFRPRPPVTRDTRALRAVFVGRLVVEKGVDGLLRAWAAAFGPAGTHQLVLVGNGHLRDSLARQAEELGIASQIVFAGHAENVEAYLAEADFGVLPSHIEGLSNTLLEFMACGLPVLASRVSGSEDFVDDGRNGWLFEPGDEAALRACLERIGQLDRAALNAAGVAARQTVQTRAGTHQVVARLLALYRGEAAVDPVDTAPAVGED